MKPFTASLALESGAYKPDTPIDTRPGVLQIGRYTVKDVHSYGLIDVTRVISKSSNVGISKIALSMPAQKLWELYHRLGFGTLSGLGFAGEQGGVLKPYSTWGAIGHANNAFGYGISVNTLQLAQAYAVLAADGVRRPLSLLRRDKPPEAEERLLSEDTTRKIRAMLELAASEGGTGAKASVSGYRVAGKTGTAHKTANGRYSPNRYRSLFAGMVPASRPRLVCVVMIDEPHRGGYYGGAIAAPVFSQIMEGALRILNIPPDAIPAQNLVVVTPAATGAVPEAPR